MTIRFVTRTILHCKCIHCGYEWDTFDKPKSCASCRRRSWNGEDNRRADPAEFVPRGSLVNGDLPQMNVKSLIDTLRRVRAILEQLVADLGPCEHLSGKKAVTGQACVCQEQSVLAEVNQQIACLELIAPTPAALRRQWRPRMAKV